MLINEQVIMQNTIRQQARRTMQNMSLLLQRHHLCICALISIAVTLVTVISEY